jgi:hypothetical protein
MVHVASQKRQRQERPRSGRLFDSPCQVPLVVEGIVDTAALKARSRRRARAPDE